MGLTLAPFGVVKADFATDSCNLLKESDSSVQCNAPGTASSSIASNNNVKNLIKNVINLLSIAVGTVSVIMIIIGGFRYVISSGDSSATKSAKDTIMYAVIGLAVVIFAQTIVRFVITNTTKSPTPKKTTFVISQKA